MCHANQYEKDNRIVEMAGWGFERQPYSQHHLQCVLSEEHIIGRNACLMGQPNASAEPEIIQHLKIKRHAYNEQHISM